MNQVAGLSNCWADCAIHGKQHPLTLSHPHSQDIEEGEGDDGDGGVATAMEGVQLSDGGRGGAGGSLPGPCGETG